MDKMDNSSQEKPTRILRTPERDQSDGKGNEVSRKQSRLPIKITKKKKSETVSTISGRQSKLPIRSSEVSGTAKKIIPVTSQASTKIVSRPTLSSSTLMDAAENDIKAKQTLENLGIILDKMEFDCEPVQFAFDDRIMSLSFSEIQGISCELEKVMTEELKGVVESGDKYVIHSKEFTKIPDVEIEIPQLSEVDLQLFSKIETENLEHQINECIHDINSSAYEILDEDPTHNLENVVHTINECIEGLTFKTDVDFRPFKDPIHEEINSELLVKTKSDVLQISSSLKLLLANKIDTTTQLGKRISCTSMEKLAKSSSLNLEVAERISQSICDLDSDLADSTGSSSTSPDLENFQEDLNGNSLLVIPNEQATEETESIHLPQENSDGNSNLEESNINSFGEDVEDKEDTDSDNMEDFTRMELKSIKVELVKLKYLIGSEDNLNKEMKVQEKSSNLVETEEIKSEGFEIQDADSVHVDSMDYESDENVHRNCSRSSCGNLTDDKTDDRDEIPDHPPKLLLKSLTNEFIKVVNSDILCSTTTVQTKPALKETEADHKRFELMKSLNNAMDDLSSEKQEHMPKPPDCCELLAIGIAKSMRNDRQQIVNETSSFAELPASELKRTFENDNENDVSIRLSRVLEALDDFSNEKLEDIMELEVCKAKLGKEANFKLNPKIEIPVKPKLSGHEKQGKAGPSSKSAYSKNPGKSEAKSIKMRHSLSEPNYDESQNLPVAVSSKGVATVKLIDQSKSSPGTTKGGSYQQIMAKRRSTQKINAQRKLSGILTRGSGVKIPVADDNSKSLLVLHKQSKFRQLGVLSTSKDGSNPGNPKRLFGGASRLDVAHSNSSTSIAAETQTSFSQILLIPTGLNKNNVISPSSSNECFLFGNPMLSEKILSSLNIDDMLSGRRVCRDWCEAITLSNAFWRKTLVYKPMDFMVSWEEFEASGLLRCNCLNICILRCDLRDPGAVDFLRVYGPALKLLVLEQCTFSLVTLQRMLLECTNLEYLEINGLTHYIMYSESIFPTGNLPKCLTCLKTLILSTGPELYHSRFGVINPGERADLNPGFISDFLTSSGSLEQVQLVGWTSCTCLSLLKILYHSRAMEKVNHLAFSDIPLDHLDFDHFLLLGLAGQNIKLQKLELSLAEPQTIFIHGRDYANLIFREIVRDHAKTLEELILDNCPITEEVFVFEMPKLRRLSIRGTNISSTDFQRLMPKLEFLNQATWFNDDAPILQHPRSQTYFGARELFLSNSVLLIFGVLSAGLCFAIYQFQPQCAAMTMFLVAIILCLGFSYFDLSYIW